MARPRLMHVVQDQILTGDIERTRKQCNHCGHYTTCIRIHELYLTDIKPGPTLIFFSFNPDSGKFEPLDYIGIGCGCYAAAHRQVAHIRSKQK